jgi:hypothetical protein
MNLRIIRTKGGEGSGNFGHAGRPGEVGGSQPNKEGNDEDENPASPKVFIDVEVSDNDAFMTRVIAAEHPAMEAFGTTVKIIPNNKAVGSEFAIGGTTFERAGEYDQQQNQVRAHPNAGVMAHEMGHAEYEYALNKRQRTWQDFAMSARASNANRDEFDKHDSPFALTPSDEFRTPKSAGQKLSNAFTKFENSLIPDGHKGVPTSYAAAWKKEMIFDGPQAVKLEGAGGEAMFHGANPVLRYVNESYAEFNEAYVFKTLKKKGFIQIIPDAYEFSKIGTKESRAAFVELRKAIHATVKDNQ